MTRLHLLAPDVFAFDDSFDVVPPGLVRFPARSVVVRLPTGELWVHAPLRLDDALAEELAGLGPVAHLVAPNLFHHTFIGDWAARYPNATLHLAPGLARKRPDLPTGRTLTGGEADAAWAGVIETIPLLGLAKLNEHVFVHASSETMIVTDLAFNMRDLSRLRGPLTRPMLYMANAGGRCAQSRLVRLLADDKPAAGLSAAAVRDRASQVSRVIPAHGEVLDVSSEVGAKEFATALAPMTGWA